MEPDTCWIPLGAPSCGCGKREAVITRVEVHSPMHATYHFQDYPAQEVHDERVLLSIQNIVQQLPTLAEPRIEIVFHGSD
jgi:hypothetical protein